MWLAIEYTSVVSALLYNELMPVTIIAVAALRGESTSSHELLGVACAIVEALLPLAFADDATPSLASSGSHPLFGDCVAFVGSVFGGLYVLVSKEVRDSWPVTQWQLVGL